MKQKIHFITYGNETFKNAKNRICDEAKQSQWFNSITSYGPENLDDSFKEQFKDILKQKRGGGYWIWKCDIIKQKLKEINENDILIYLDAGCTINTKAHKRFNKYISLLNKDKKNRGIISFQLRDDLLEKTYTTREIFHHFKIDIDSKIANSGQHVGGILIMKKNNHLKKIINVWHDTILNNALLFTDHYIKNQESFFIENRHDQSILSMIRKIHDSIVIERDETYFRNFKSKCAEKFPFWATRKN